MAYSVTVRERAYVLFLQGENAEQIALALKGDFPRISANTVRAWIEEPDSNGETWEHRRHAVDRAARKRIEDQSATERTKAKGRFAHLSLLYYEKIVAKLASAEITSIDQAGYVFRAMQQGAVTMEEAELQRWHPANAAAIVLEVLQELPKTSAALKGEFGLFRAKLAERLNTATDSKEIEVKTIESPSEEKPKRGKKKL